MISTTGTTRLPTGNCGNSRCAITGSVYPALQGNTDDLSLSRGYTVMTEKHINNKIMLSPGKLCQRFAAGVGV
jgi:hypothetical protein